MINISITKQEAEKQLAQLHMANPCLGEAFPGHLVSVTIVEEPLPPMREVSKEYLTQNKIFLIKFCRDFVSLTYNAPRSSSVGSVIPALYQSKIAVEKIIEDQPNFFSGV